MSTIKINELATSSINLSDFIVKADSNGLATKNTVQGLADVISTVGNSEFKGSLTKAETPSEDGWYFPSENGTYANAGDLVVALDNKLNIIIVSESNFELLIIPVIIPIDSLPTKGSSNAVESGGVFSYLDTNLKINKKIKLPFTSSSEFGRDIDLSNKMQGFLIDLKLNGNPVNGRSLSLQSFRRNVNGQWSINILNEIIVEGNNPSTFSFLCSFFTTSSPENGNNITIHKMLEDSNSGVTGTIAVNWSVIPSGDYSGSWAGKGAKISDYVYGNHDGIIEESLKLDLKQNKNITPVILLPYNVYAFPSVELNLYNESLVKGTDDGLNGLKEPFKIEINSSYGNSYDRNYRVKPTNSQSGITDLVLLMYDTDRNQLAFKFNKLNITTNNPPAEIKRVLIIGDSTTSDGFAVETLRDNFVNLGSNIPLFIGNRGSSPVNHEGRGGWSFNSYSGTGLSNDNPFYNFSTNQLDISKYRSDLGITELIDCISIQLGINDLSFVGRNTSSQIQEIINSAKLLINAFISDNSNCKIIVQLPLSDSNSRDGYGVAFNSFRNKSNYQANMYDLKLALLTTFDNSLYNSNVTCGVAGIAVDRWYGYPMYNRKIADRINVFVDTHNDPLHPNEEGQRQMGDAIFPLVYELIK